MARILVVDDSEEVREYLAATLRTSYEVVEAADLAEARQELASSIPDALVVDLDLPDGDGLSLIPLAASAQPPVRVVVVTAHTSYEHTLRALHAGVHDFICKPIERTELRAAVRGAVEARELEVRNRELVLELAERVTTVNEMLSITRSISGSSNLEGVLRCSLDRSMELVGAECGAIRLVEPDGSLTVAVARGAAGRPAGDAVPLPWSGISGWALANRRPLAVNDVRRDPRFDPRADEAGCGPVRNVLACPLLVRDEPLGILQLGNCRAGKFDREARLSAETLSFSIAAAIENAKITDRLARSQAALLELNGSLERRILERTEELRSANERLTATNKCLEETRDQMVQAEKMASIGSIAAGVAHEINNPIGFINSNLHTLSAYMADLRPLIADLRALCPPSSPLQARMQEIDLDVVLEDIGTLVRESQDGVRRVVKIVKDLKTYSRAEQGPPEEADLQECIESALSLSRSEVKYVADVRTDLEPLPRVRCFPVQVTQVLVNLLVNAAHAIREHGTITVRTRSEPGAAVIEVSDTGCGIPPENLNRIFDPFFTTKEPGRGTGLGLSLSYEILQRHRGELSVESRVGEGSTFRIRLPLEGPGRAAA